MVIFKLTLMHLMADHGYSIRIDTATGQPPAMLEAKHKSSQQSRQAFMAQDTCYDDPT